MNFAEANASLVPVKHDLALSMQLVCFAWKLLARGRLRRARWRPPWPPDTKDLRKGSSLPGELNRGELGQLGLEIFDASMEGLAVMLSPQIHHHACQDPGLQRHPASANVLVSRRCSGLLPPGWNGGGLRSVK
jgi:hypothetical protein